MENALMSKFFARSATVFTAILISLFLLSCASSKKKEAPKQTTGQVEKLEQNSEYSAVDSTWNEFYQ